jgi:Cys-rich protein (TIGR01571 family)
VTVPEGGVQAGQEIEVPYPTTYTIKQGAAEDSGGPMGHWKHDLCSCWDVFCNGLFWMALFCTPMTKAQLMTRLKLDWCGLRTEDASQTFAIITFLWVMFLIFNYWLVGLGIAWVIFMVIVGTRLRGTFRKRYNIPVSGKCGNSDCMDDCCCIFWCDCCSVIQMVSMIASIGKNCYD